MTKSNIPLFETDPDIQFYNELRIIFNENSDYYFEDQFNELIYNTECLQNLSFLHANIMSLKANRVMFETFIDNLQKKCSVIGLTETWLTSINGDLHDMHGYSHVYLCMQGRPGGGVSLFIRNNISCIVQQDFTVLTDQVEQLFIEIDKSVLHVNKNVIVGIMYRPPDKDPVTLIEMVQKVMEKIDKEKKIGYLLGDFN